MSFPLGKLPPELLGSLLKRYPPTDPRVLVGPRVGEDAAIIDLGGGQCLVAKTDPITFVTDEVGWYAVHVNANDIATTGGTPLWFMAALLLPENRTDETLVTRIFEQMAEAASDLNVNLVGGHTEITHGITRPIVTGVMLGLVEKDKIISTSGAQAGDELILTKGVPIEAAAIIAHEKRNDLANMVLSAYLDRGEKLLREPGISVVRDARIATQSGRIHAMHDPTEGGLATGLWEMAEASGRRLVVDCSEVVTEEGAALCAATGLDPLASIASGALLIAAHPDDAPGIVDNLSGEGIKAFRFGRVEDGPVEVMNSNTNDLMIKPVRDEIARLFE